MGQLVLKHGGTLDKFTGDGLVVVFGLEDCDPKLAAKRCADMALAMRPALGSLLWRWRSRLSRLPTGQRIGIHSGECLVGSFGCPERLN
jgi:adenylate cyclase